MPEGTEIQSAGASKVMGDILGQFDIAMGGILLIDVVQALLLSGSVPPTKILIAFPLAISGAIFSPYVYCPVSVCGLLSYS
ncbi:hypothetical protein SAMN05444339_11814 [Loktanella atrilutea]|uniref:Uncharacterized protein n=1 Tax=Loktanella atrilutea TaxID=366533 RepID=A0A1M5F8U9_LOKAT|nr:hypothetical protein [Loktanella atrilutea]SHF87906.1 hypothetical protein SAMN05444339_11814 [Loktanella atrilutea]